MAPVYTEYDTRICDRRLPLNVSFPLWRILFVLPNSVNRTRLQEAKISFYVLFGGAVRVAIDMYSSDHELQSHHRCTW